MCVVNHRKEDNIEWSVEYAGVRKYKIIVKDLKRDKEFVKYHYCHYPNLLGMDLFDEAIINEILNDLIEEVKEER